MDARTARLLRWAIIIVIISILLLGLPVVVVIPAVLALLAIYKEYILPHEKRARSSQGSSCVDRGGWGLSVVYGGGGVGSALLWWSEGSETRETLYHAKNSILSQATSMAEEKSLEEVASFLDANNEEKIDIV